MTRRVAAPLGIWTYHIRNKRRTLPLIVVLALAVFGLSIGVVLTGSFLEAANLRSQQYRYFVTVHPNRDRGYESINQRIQTAVRQIEALKSLYQVAQRETFIPGLLGQTQMTVYMVDSSQLAALLDDLGSTVVAGQLPGPNEGRDNWLVVSRLVAEARGLRVGDEIGREVDSDEWLPYRFIIKAIVDGPTNLSFGSLAYLARRMPDPPLEVLVAVPRPGQLAALGQALTALEGEEIWVTSWESEQERQAEDFASMTLLVFAVNIVLSAVFSLVVGLINLLYYMQRLTEFATLQALGYGKRFLLRRVALESLTLTFGSWLIGLVLAQAVFALLTAFFLGPGIVLTAWSVRVLLLTAPFPIMTGIAGLVTVGRVLARLDPIVVIDRKG